MTADNHESTALTEDLMKTNKLKSHLYSCISLKINFYKHFDVVILIINTD